MPIVINGNPQIGDLVRVSDGTPCPPRRHVKKYRAWAQDNYAGKLVKPLLTEGISYAVQVGCCVQHYGPGSSRTITISKEGT